MFLYWYFLLLFLQKPLYLPKKPKKFGHPKKIAVTILKLEQNRFTTDKLAQTM